MSVLTKLFLGGERLVNTADLLKTLKIPEVI